MATLTSAAVSSLTERLQSLEHVVHALLDGESGIQSLLALVAGELQHLGVSLAPTPARSPSPASWRPPGLPGPV